MRFIAAALVALAGSLLAQNSPTDAERSSEQAVRLLLGGQGSTAWALLRQRADNTTRTFVVRDIARLGVPPDVVVERLRSEPDPSARRALIVALGGYSKEKFPDIERTAVTGLLLDWYATDPDPGIHSAIEWLLRGPVGGPSLRPDWGESAALAARAASWRGRAAGGHRWYVTAEGQTMALLTGPAFVHMGSPADEPGRQPSSDSPAEPTHEVSIPRSFAVGTTEVTVAQFRRYLDANPHARRGYQYPGAPARMEDVLRRFSPDDEGPAIAVTWYEAAAYCNWLSAREGLPTAEWVYPAGEAAIADGMQMPRNYLRRSGYRLLTEAEWEFAARAGTRTSRFFGTADALLSEYAWFARRPRLEKEDPVDPADPQRSSPVGRLKPNDFGLFDVYGNVWEWTQDRVERYETAAVRADVEDTVLRVMDRDARTRRGGAFPYGAAMARSAARGTVTSLPTNRRDNVGFRIARTIR